MPQTMKALTLTALIALAATTQARSATFNPDLYYDYDVYAAQWETHWYARVLWNDGSASEYGGYDTQQGAQDFAVWLWLHFANVRDIDVISRTEPGTWYFVRRYDKLADAERTADQFELKGYATDIRSVLVTLKYSGPASLQR